MEVKAINMAAEVRKFFRGKETRVSPEVLWHLIGDEYLEMLKDRTEAGELDELFRVYRLEAPRII